MAVAFPLAFALALLSVGAVRAGDGPGVVVSTVARIPFPLTVEALGTARANESIEVRPKIAETISAIRFREGQHVEAGDVLVELEDTWVRAAVAEAEAELADSNSRYVRSHELFRSKLVPASELESVQAERDADRAAVDAARARLAETVVRAPFAGRVGLRRVSLGSLVSPATVITTLDDTETIKLDFDVPETALSHVAEGLSVVAHSAAWPDARFEGEVVSVDTRVDPVSRTVTVRALIPNADGLLRPGMFLRVELLHDDREALMVPEQAILPEQSRQFVLLVDERGEASKREIRIGRRRPGQVEVLEGLASGDVIIVEGTQKVQPGMTVRVVGRIEVAR